MKITTKVRATIRQILADGPYDVETMKIGRDGAVSAVKDADKTHSAPETVRYLVGNVADMVTPDGTRREGFR